VTQFSVVLVICTVALLGMCGFLLYGMIDQNVNAIGAIVFVIVVEITPLLLLIFTVYAKRTNVFSFWYSTARGRLSRATTSAGSSSPSVQSSSAVDWSSIEMSSSVRSL
jgi:FtsH-binding integral membrane protein